MPLSHLHDATADVEGFLGTKRKRISDRTKLAATLLALHDVPYEHAKLMSEDQIISLYHWDHNALHAFEGGDEFWNLTPMLIAAHRQKTKLDAAKIAKSKRIRAKAAAALCPKCEQPRWGITWCANQPCPSGYSAYERKPFGKSGISKRHWKKITSRDAW